MSDFFYLLLFLWKKNLIREKRIPGKSALEFHCKWHNSQFSLETNYTDGKAQCMCVRPIRIEMTKRFFSFDIKYHKCIVCMRWMCDCITRLGSCVINCWTVFSIHFSFRGALCDFITMKFFNLLVWFFGVLHWFYAFRSFLFWYY